MSTSHHSGGSTDDASDARTRAMRHLVRWGPAAAITVLAALLTTPLLSGQMPMSADHTVHLARIVEQAAALHGGHVSTWSWTWFFGAPIGELYPPLGDLLVIAIRSSSLGALSWPAAYAMGFFVVFASQGWAMLFVARRLGLGQPAAIVAGLVAAAAVLLDPGYMREGGWMYCVTFGVWPQTLSTTLVWIGLAGLVPRSGELRGWKYRSDAADEEEAVDLDDAHPARPTPLRRRDLARSALVLGGALLAHPVALPALVIAGPLMVLLVARDARDRGAMVFTVIAALALAAFWVMPMLRHRAWMASYGWLFAPLADMAKQMINEGQWAQRMAPAVGWMALAGIVSSVARVRRGPRFPLFVAIFSLTLWGLASSDAFWSLRLDRVSEGFGHIQYQRFLILAKPGLALLAGSVVGHLVDDAMRTTRARRGVAAALAVLAIGWAGSDMRSTASKFGVGDLQTQRLGPRGEVLGDEVREAAAWLGEHLEPGERVAFSDTRNTHWFMDATTFGLGLDRLYKVGFTPGDNFVHKPEAGGRQLLQRLNVAYLVRRSRGDKALPGQVAAFGSLRILDRRRKAPVGTVGTGPIRARVVQIPDKPSLHALAANDTVATITDESPLSMGLTLEGGEAPVRVIFDVAGYPRWHLTVNGAEHPWFEVPAVGTSEVATVGARERGDLRGGRAHGDTGREPILIAADVSPGSKLRLEYLPRDALDWLADLLSVLSLATLVPVALGRGDRFRANVARLERAARLVGDRRAVGGVLVLAVAALGSRWISNRAAEGRHAYARVSNLHRAEVAPLKTDMLIRPAVVLRPKESAEAHADIVALPCGVELTGWAAIDDDRGKRSRGTRTELAVEMSDGSVVTTVSVPHRPGRRHFAFMLGCDGQQTNHDVRVRARTTQAKPLPVGFDIEVPT